MLVEKQTSMFQSCQALKSNPFWREQHSQQAVCYSVPKMIELKLVVPLHGEEPLPLEVIDWPKILLLLSEKKKIHHLQLCFFIFSLPIYKIGNLTTSQEQFIEGGQTHLAFSLFTGVPFIPITITLQQFSSCPNCKSPLQITLHCSNK